MRTCFRSLRTDDDGGNPGSPGDRILPSDFGYAYDSIGNRKSYTLDATTPTYYCPNAVNQYLFTDDVADTCDDPDPSETEIFDYDTDGNLKADGTMTHVWNGENRLVEAFPTSPAVGDVKVRFAYDYMGRRVRKEVLAWDDGAGDWAATATTDLKFVYDGWNVVQVLDGTTTGNPVTQQYTWGLDLSGTFGGAGGISGLLAAVETKGTASTTDDDAYWYFYDGNGNVGQVIAADGQSTVAKYEYDPYGKLIASSGTYANANPFRFSTKWFDVETGLYSFTYRYYASRLGRWVSRDPIGEDGGVNLSAYITNDPVGQCDFLGFWTIERNGEPRAIVVAQDGDTIQTLAPLVRLEPDEYPFWLRTVEGHLPVPDRLERQIPRGCKYTVPNTAYVDVGHIKNGFKFWGKSFAAHGHRSPDMWWAVEESKDIAEHFRRQGYLVAYVRTASRAIMFSHLRNENIAAWGVVAHGEYGVIWAADPANTDDELVGFTAFDANPELHHRLSTVILYVCKTKMDLDWQNMVSRFGEIWWTEGSVYMWTDWDDLDHD